jgi:hypothetical protein
VKIDMPAGDVASSEALQTALNLETADWADSSVKQNVESSLDTLFDKEGDGGAGEPDL